MQTTAEILQQRIVCLGIRPPPRLLLGNPDFFLVALDPLLIGRDRLLYRARLASRCGQLYGGAGVCIRYGLRLAELAQTSLGVVQSRLVTQYLSGCNRVRVRSVLL